MPLLLIGAGPGVSAAIARRFGKDGTPVGLVARNPDRLTALTADLRAEGINAVSASADAGDVAALSQAIADLTAQIGAPTTLVYNASVMVPGTPLDLTPERLTQDMAVNVTGALIAAQAVAPAMIAEGRGTILFTGGGLALEPYPEWTSLAAGKAALRSLALSLYKDLAPKGVHVSVLAICGIVAPGTPFDPDIIAAEYHRLATAPRGLADREVIFQPPGTDPHYNDPDRLHAATTLQPLRQRLT
ncbi:MAG: SDR family NAD(P)-dependent oxidoreductase [Pseudomonadota bacterium]